MLIEYLEELWETFVRQPVKILCTSFLLWIILPIIIFGIWGVVQVIFYSSLSLEIFTGLFVNTMIPWWVSIIINLKKFILGYLLSLVITVILVNQDILEPIDFGGLIQRLRNM